MPIWETEEHQRERAKASVKPPQPTEHETVGGVPVGQAVEVARHALAAPLHPVQPRPASTGVRRAPLTPSRTTAPQASGRRLAHPGCAHASIALRPSTAAQPVASRGTPRAQPNDALTTFTTVPGESSWNHRITPTWRCTRVSSAAKSQP